MTISEQIREAALCEVNPYTSMSNVVFHQCVTHKSPIDWMHGIPDADLRTFMLLVAEALE